VTTHLTTAFIARAMRDQGYHVFEGPETEVTGGAFDSRRVCRGDLFTAFRGENVDGNLFVSDALTRGAVAAICEHAPEPVPTARTVVVAPNATRAVGQLAHAWRKACNPRVVGITGTVGKTTAKDLTAAALSARFRTHSSTGNLNSREGLPLALMSLRRDHEVSVLEMGMDTPGEIAELCAIAEPDVGVVLNIGLTHVSKLGSAEAIEAEKLALARWLPATGTAVINVDDARIAVAASEIRARVLSFGKAPFAVLHCGPVVDRGLDGTSFVVTYAGETCEVHCRVPGLHVVPGALASVAVCVSLGMTLSEAAAAVEAAETEGRVHVLSSDSGATIIDDCYNSSPASLAGALRMLGGLKGRRLALIGRMAELGEYEEEEHRRIGEVAAETCDILVAVGGPCRVTVETAKTSGLEDATWFADKQEAAAAVRTRLASGDFVLVKASRSQAFETILPLLEGRL
jgi:UDP-N-acetylmuramoyl-tripeptide--D-alanyl-D-alanine ligase